MAFSLTEWSLFWPVTLTINRCIKEVLRGYTHLSLPERIALTWALVTNYDEWRVCQGRTFQ